MADLDDLREGCNFGLGVASTNKGWESGDGCFFTETGRAFDNPAIERRSSIGSRKVAIRQTCICKNIHY